MPGDRPVSLAAALAELQQHLPRIDKNAQGQRSKYANLAEITRVLMPMLGERGFSFICMPTMHDGQFVLHYELRHADTPGVIDGFYPLPSSAPQTMGGAITYARRYCLLAVTGAAPDEDDDDAQAAEQAAEQAARAQRNHAPEVRADGSATEAELTRMRRGHEPGVWKSDGTAENDPFYDQPPAEEQPESMSSSQRSSMFGGFVQLKMQGDRDKQLDFIEAVVKRRPEHRDGLTYVEAGQVLKALHEAGSMAK